jgi:hypothetical protein
MKKYKFLLKPIFFIFNLIFATWLVLKIEKIKPSDFGEHKSMFTKAPAPRILTKSDKMVLKTFFMEFKYGLIDTAQLNKKLDKFLASPEEAAEVESPTEVSRTVSVR